MKKIALFLLYLPLGLAAQPTTGKSPEPEKEKILVYLNSFEETTRLVNNEFERTNTDEVKTKRKDALNLFASNRAGAGVTNDTYGVAVQEHIVQWMNETLREICESMPGKNYVIVTGKTLPNYPADSFRHVLKHKYFFEKGDPLKARMVFYIHDRQTDQDIMDCRELAGRNTYFPFFYYSGEKMYPFYTMVRSTKVKKQWVKFFRGLPESPRVSHQSALHNPQ